MAGTDGLGFGEAKAEIQFVRWIFGWNLMVSWGMIMVIVGGFGYLVGFPYQAGLVGFLAGPPIWFYETRYINGRYEGPYEAYFEDLEVVGSKVLAVAGAPEDADQFTLISEGKSSLLVEPKQQYEAAVLAVDEESIWIYDVATLDLMFLEGEFGKDPDEVRTIDIEDLESVSYEDQALEFRTTGEAETVRVASTTEPTDAVEAITARMAEEDTEE